MGEQPLPVRKAIDPGVHRVRGIAAAHERAFYYVRVLEIPTPRWTDV